MDSQAENWGYWALEGDCFHWYGGYPSEEEAESARRTNHELAPEVLRTAPTLFAPMAEDTLSDTQLALAEECDALKIMLIEKNAAYGSSAIDPVRIFSKASPIEQILVRIDDKLSRIARGKAAGEDVEQDLIGYLILLRVARRLTKKE